jgi:hypothetical protein
MSYRHHTDNAGQVPEVGDFVAYNYSGQIATGWIRYVGRSKIFTIIQLHPEEGRISRVRGGARCLLVLDKA